MIAVVTALAIATNADPRAMLFFYWAPLLTGACAWIAITIAPEHYGCDAVPAFAFETTRSTISNAWMRWFLWGTNFHTEHHLHPNVPAPRLAELHDYIAPRCAHIEPSYLRWHARLFRELAKGSRG